MRQAIISSAAVIATGVFVAAIAWTYPLGTITRMGPGYLPFVLGLVLIAIGMLIGIVELNDAEPPEEQLTLRPLIAVVAAILAWTAIVPRFGLVPATCALVLIASFSQRRPSPVAIVATAAFLSIFGVLAFIEGLGIRMTAFRF